MPPALAAVVSGAVVDFAGTVAGEALAAVVVVASVTGIVVVVIWHLSPAHPASHAHEPSNLGGPFPERVVARSCWHALPTCPASHAHEPSNLGVQFPERVAARPCWHVLPVKAGLHALRWQPLVVPLHVPVCAWLRWVHGELSQALHTPLVVVPDPIRCAPALQAGWARHGKHACTRCSLPAHASSEHFVQVPLLFASCRAHWPLGHTVHTRSFPNLIPVLTAHNAESLCRLSERIELHCASKGACVDQHGH